MCSVSMIYDKYRPVEPFRWSRTDASTVTWDVGTPRSPLDIFEELVRVAGELDRALGLADCEDPKKAKWLDEVRKLVRKHETDKLNERLAAQP